MTRTNRPENQFMHDGQNDLSSGRALSGAKRRPSCPGLLRPDADTSSAADQLIADAQLRTSLDWLHTDREQADLSRNGLLHPMRERACTKERLRAGAMGMHHAQLLRQKWRSEEMTGRRSQFLGLLCTGEINVAKLGADRVLRKSPKRAMPFAPLSTRVL